MKNTTQKIAIDIGYGDTKVMVNDKTFKFPSAISQIRQSQIQSSEQDAKAFSFNNTYTQTPQCYELFTKRVDLEY